jgi:hypothetical protein
MVVAIALPMMLSGLSILIIGYITWELKLKVSREPEICPGAGKLPWDGGTGCPGRRNSC